MKFKKIILLSLSVITLLSNTLSVNANEKTYISNLSSEELETLLEKNKNKKINSDTLLEYVNEIGEIYNIDPYLLYAICEKESSMRIYVANKSRTCFGLMQVSEKWHKDRMDKLNVDNLFDPYGNILVAADFLAELFEINKDPYYVLMRYNMKTSTANELYKKGEISDYALKIVDRAEELKKEFESKSK